MNFFEGDRIGNRGQSLLPPRARPGYVERSVGLLSYSTITHLRELREKPVRHLY